MQELQEYAKKCQEMPGLHLPFIAWMHELMEQILKFFISYLARDLIALIYKAAQEPIFVHRENWVRGEGAGQKPFVVKCIGKVQMR